jgi:small-conductance mechanosensitive channel
LLLMLSDLLDSTAGTPLADVIHELLLLAPRIGMGVLTFVGFWIASVVARNLILRFARRADFTLAFILRLAARTASIGLLVFGGITALGTMGINVSALVAGLGLTGFALGFALKDVLSNLIAGILILVYRPFRLNDYISVISTEKMEGRVIEIDLRYTTLEHEGQKYLVPNSVLLTNSIAVVEGKHQKVA